MDLTIFIKFCGFIEHSKSNNLTLSAYIRNGEIDKSKIAEHSLEHKHGYQWDKASIIGKEKNSGIKKLKESAFNHCTDHVISQPSIDISPIWLPITRPEMKKKKL